jgi:hypothetical protein
LAREASEISFNPIQSLSLNRNLKTKPMKSSCVFLSQRLLALVSFCSVAWFLYVFTLWTPAEHRNAISAKRPSYAAAQFARADKTLTR